MDYNENQVVVIEGLRYSANQAEILKGISLSIGKAELVGLIGPNGAGKTTLLKCINNINKADGDIQIKGKSIKDMNDREIARGVAMMSQNTSVSFSFPALDIVLMGRYPHMNRFKRESREDYRIARENMELTDTLRFEKTPVTQMSGGESQRVLFAKVLTQETEIILLDEPTASLDITHQEQIFKHARDLSEAGKTVIAAVHDLKIAVKYCTKLVLMKDGAIVAAGNPEEVLTAENISRAYGVNALVYRNRVTGLLDFYLHSAEGHKDRARIHVIGGGGAASGVIRQLFEYGYSLSAGVFAHGDSDLQCAEVFNIRHIVGEPFSDISDKLFEENIRLTKAADVTILCNMLFGRQNIRNLEAASYAGKLIIIEDDKPEARDFTGGQALKLYNELKKKAVITTSARLHEVL